MRIALFGRTPKEEDIIYVQNLIDRIDSAYKLIFIHERFYDKISSKVKFPTSVKVFNSKQELIENADILISLGGDGTFLDTLPVVMDSNIPVLGVNLGHLGFLTSVGREGIDVLLEELENNNYNVENHSLIKLTQKTPDSKEIYALNDICIKSCNSGDLLNTKVFVDNEYLANYKADGVIITTPTGSTAYNLSSGGPIISPKSHCLGITPICPHNLTLRPIIIPDNSIITLEVENIKNEISIYIDSNSILLKSPFRVEISKADFEIKVIRLQGQSFFTAIRNKLMWGTNIRFK